MGEELWVQLSLKICHNIFPPYLLIRNCKYIWDQSSIIRIKIQKPIPVNI
jgi:hypothetical protein